MRRLRRNGIRRCMAPGAKIRQIEAPQINIGANLRTLREKRGLTIKALAKRSGLNVNTLSLIENKKSSPSVNTLQQIAKALEVPIAALFAQDQPRQNIHFYQALERPRVAFEHGAIADLGSGLSNCPFEALLVEIEPNARSGITPLVHSGYELVFCLQGIILYMIDQENFRLEAGDSLFFEAPLPHTWQNPCPKPARALMVLCPETLQTPDWVRF